MEWYGYFIIILGVIVFFSVILIFLSRFQIKLRLKAYLVRKAPYLFFIEIRNDHKINFGLSKVIDGTLKTDKNRVYGIKKDHVKLIPSYGITGVVLSETLASSIDPKVLNESEQLSPEFINGIIKRVKATAVGDQFQKMFMYMIIVLGVQCVLFIGMLFIIIKFYSALQQAGINISF